MNNPQTFTAKDIERYHRGEMTAAEMHELEKAALDDPLLADALEGYRYTKTPAVDLQALQNRLQQRLEKEDHKVIPLYRRQWLRIAALFVLLAGGGWLVFQTFTTQENNIAATETTSSDIAMATDSAAPLQQPLPPALVTDSLSSLQDMAAVEKPEQRAANKTGEPLTVMSESTTGNTTAREDNTAAINETVATAPAADRAVRSAAPTVSASRRQDSTGNQDAAAQRNNAADMEEANVRLQSRTKMQVAEPVGGWKSFADYVVENRRSNAALKIGPAIRGEVELRFDIDEAGRPVNITVSRSLCTPCDEEAVRLLKEGPKWTARNSSGKVSILFP